MAAIIGQAYMKDPEGTTKTAGSILSGAAAVAFLVIGIVVVLGTLAVKGVDAETGNKESVEDLIANDAGAKWALAVGSFIAFIGLAFIIKKMFS